MGGIVGGLVGLMMAVPMTVIAVRAVGYFRAAFAIDGITVRTALSRTLTSPDGD
jgi:predicted PurR-regulated permease PerM